MAIDIFSPVTLQAFLLAFTRVGSIFLPLGLPSFQNTPAKARVAMAAILTLMLWPEWSSAQPPAAPVWSFVTELTLGTMIGLAITAVLEALTMALQMIGLQSGYQYASTIDPTSQADSPVLPVLGQLLGLLSFFTLGGDHLMLRCLARSFRVWPQGAVPAAALTTAAVSQAGAMILETSLRFALPLIALLVLVDLAMGVVTRAHSQLQLLSIAFPVKMLLALFALAALLPAWTALLNQRISGIEKALTAVLSPA